MTQTFTPFSQENYTEILSKIGYIKRLLERLSTHCELISKAVADDSRPFFSRSESFLRLSVGLFFPFFFFSSCFFYSFNANCGQSWVPWSLFFDQFEGFVLFSLIFGDGLFVFFYLTHNMAVIHSSFLPSK